MKDLIAINFIFFSFAFISIGVRMPTVTLSANNTRSFTQTDCARKLLYHVAWNKLKEKISEITVTTKNSANSNCAILGMLSQFVMTFLFLYYQSDISSHPIQL